MTNRFLGPLLCGSLLLFAVLTPAAAPAAPVNGVCSPTKMKYSASAKNSSQTTSTTFVNIPEAGFNFVQGGSSASCVLVRFSAETAIGTNQILIVRAFLDNTTAALPAEAVYSSGRGDDNGARVFEFVFPSVAPGSHLVRMQFRSFFGSACPACVQIDRHNTVVQYAP